MGLTARPVARAGLTEHVTVSMTPDVVAGGSLESTWVLVGSEWR